MARLLKLNPGGAFRRMEARWKAYAQRTITAPVAAGLGAWEANNQPNRPRYRVALFGLFGSGNFGNDGSLESMLEALRDAQPDSEFACICHDCRVVAESFGIDTLSISPSRSRKPIASILNRLFLRIPGKLVDFVYSLRRIRNFDIMIMPGTGILDDFGERPTGMPLDIFRWCLAARLCGVRIAFVSVGAGPIVNPVSRRLMVAAAKLAHYRSYRDQVSKEFMTEYGLDTSRDLVFPDLAFRLPVPLQTSVQDGKSRRPAVAVGVMNYRGWYGFVSGGEQIYAEYIEKITRFVLYLVDSGYDVRLLIGDLSDEDAADIVLRGIRDVRPNIPDDRLSLGCCHSLREVMNQISETDFVVATRFHNIVCALKLGKPTISVGYARKNDVLLDQMGLRPFCQHIERFDWPVLIDQFSELVSNRSEYERKIRECTDSFIRSLELQEDMLLRVLAPRHASHPCELTTQSGCS